MSKHSKKGKKAKKKKYAKKHERKAARLAKSTFVSRKQTGVAEDEHGNILVAAKARRLHKHRASRPVEADGVWSDYVSGGKNHDGALIDDVLVRDDRYVVYLQGDRVIPEGDPEALRSIDEIAPLIARITPLLPDNPVLVRAINTEIARAYDLCFSGWIAKSKAVLHQLLARLEGSRIAMARLHYVWAGIVTSAVCWLLILLCAALGFVTADRLIWFQAIGIGGTGGFFAVALSQRTIPIDLSHSTLVRWTSGVARILVAMAAALVCLLSIKGGIFMGLTEKATSGYPELFFCFLAGFSETFVQKLLRDNETTNPSPAPAIPKPDPDTRPKHKALE